LYGGNDLEKSDIVDLILKAAAVYLFVLSIIALFSALESVIGIIIVLGSSFAKFGGEISIAQAALPTFTSSSIGGILKSVLYIVFARNLYNGGSWLRWIFDKKASIQTD
jgi:hypothetical protein